MWIPMNESQERMYSYIAENPGCTYLDLSKHSRYFNPRRACRHGAYQVFTWPDHLRTLVAGNRNGFADARIKHIPKMVVEVSTIKPDAQERRREALDRGFHLILGSHNYTRRYWPVLGPFISERGRERRATEAREKQVERLVTDWVGVA